ncbi:DUF998 domain-containing protein [Microbacterium sp.]|uniref:DUF998 domain-containing protein n=1 Tax=Microbacterium sp. TaxID=51671 RepID=UPI0028121760|nr:DUF998 domain-containing protein [Microbacterium sp.]
MTTTTPAPVAARPRTATIGAILLIAGTLQFFIAHLITQAAWTSPAYSLWNNYISDLGATVCGPVLQNYVCSPLHPIMNAAFILQGVLLLIGIGLLIRSRLVHTRPRAWQIMVAIAGISWILVGLMPENVNLTGHSIGALPIFILGNIALIAAGISRSTRTMPVARRSAVILGIAGLIGFILTAIAVSNPTGPIGIGVAERITVFPLQIWALIAGAAILRSPMTTSREDHSDIAGV